MSDTEENVSEEVVEGEEEEDGGSDSREKTKQWLEDILQTYYSRLLDKEKGVGDKSKSKEGAKSDELPIQILDFDIGPGFAVGAGGDGRVSTLSDLLSLHVRYKLTPDSKEEKTENLLVKIPPNDKADREMAQMAQVDRREIHFYSEALPQLEEWAKSRKADIKLAVPRCYFSKYHSTQPLPPPTTTTTASTVGGDQLGQTGDGGEEDKNPVVVSEAESVLVLEDMRPAGFSMRDFNTGLSLAEAHAALGQIAVIHGLSWAMQEVTEVPLDETWELTYRPHKAASAYKTMIEHGFPTLSDFLERQEPDGHEILIKLQALHPKAIELLYELLKPPPPPAPSCLTHMDFWCNNLLFKKKTIKSTTCENANNSIPNGVGESCSKKEEEEEENPECLILDWQMMAISRPTHDVALLLFTSLTPEIRSQHTATLLAHYWKVFQDTASKVGVELPFTFGTIENEFKKSQLLALLLVIGSIDLALDSAGTEERLIEALRSMCKEDLI